MTSIKPRWLMVIVGIVIAVLLAYPSFYTRTETAEALNQVGGGDLATEPFVIVDGMVCFPIPTSRVEYVIVTATPNPTQSTARTQTPLPSPTPSASLTPSPTLTATPVLIMPSATKVTVTTTVTAVSAKCTQIGAEHAVSAEGHYRVTGLWQYIRSTPTTTPIVDNRIGSFQRDKVVEVFWTARDERGVLWVSYVVECNKWLSTTLGIYPYIP